VGGYVVGFKGYQMQNHRGIGAFSKSEIRLFQQIKKELNIVIIIESK
jgi:hypothetical protein